jgi:3-methyl-2-oxobutanoate hydroxymethyltransferase
MTDRAKVTIPYLKNKKEKGEKITMLTAYDYPLALIVDRVGVDMILVGDSLGMVVLGYESTVPVTMDEMIHHCKAVRRGTRYAFLVGDMPFMSYNVCIEEAIVNAGRFIKEAGCDAVKLEGGLEVAETVRAIVDAGIPVVAHIGLTPQTATLLGGFKVQGKDVESAQRLLDSARALDGAGACSLVMECVPDKLAAKITQSVRMPTIGIGAGSVCDGQVLVIHDVLGLFEKFRPKFVKQYVNLLPLIEEALKNYVREVEGGIFPSSEHAFSMGEEEFSQIK